MMSFARSKPRTIRSAGAGAKRARAEIGAALTSLACLIMVGAPANALGATIADGNRYIPETMAIVPGELAAKPTEAKASRAVRIDYAFAASKYPVTVAQFARFVRETDFDTGNHCYTHVGNITHDTFTEGSWNDPKFPQGPNSPVVCVSWNEAQAYVNWLSKKTGRAYRLLSEAEYEYVNRAGTSTAYWWGDNLGTGQANCKGCGSAWDDKSSSPVGSFAPNPFGLYDTSGNIWSWTADCWNEDIAAAPGDGTAAVNGDCGKHAIRGGSYGHGPELILPTSRHSIATDVHDQHIGFRVAETLPASK